MERTTYMTSLCYTFIAIRAKGLFLDEMREKVNVLLRSLLYLLADMRYRELDAL